MKSSPEKDTPANRRAVAGKCLEPLAFETRILAIEVAADSGAQKTNLVTGVEPLTQDQAAVATESVALHAASQRTALETEGVEMGLIGLNPLDPAVNQPNAMLDRRAIQVQHASQPDSLRLYAVFMHRCILVASERKKSNEIRADAVGAAPFFRPFRCDYGRLAFSAASEKRLLGARQPAKI
jgi:hypothetical protein